MKQLKKDGTGLFVMATKAYHKMGEISRDEADLAIVFSEDNENLYGNWFYGYGFIDVRFPKNTTRKPTSEEIEKFKKMSYGINGVKYGDLSDIKDYLYGDNCDKNQKRV